MKLVDFPQQRQCALQGHLALEIGVQKDQTALGDFLSDHRIQHLQIGF